MLAKLTAMDTEGFLLEEEEGSEVEEMEDGDQDCLEKQVIYCHIMCFIVVFLPSLLTTSVYLNITITLREVLK